MKKLLLLLALVSLVSCGKASGKEKEKELPRAKAIAQIHWEDVDSYQLAKYSDDDAVCYMIYKTEAISVSCIPKK